MQVPKALINTAVFIGAISAAAVLDTKIPRMDLTKRACNEEQFRQCTRNYPTGTGGGPIGRHIGNYTLLEKSQGFTLKGIADKIKAPVFVGDGQNDMLFPGQAKELTKQLGSRATYHLFFETALEAGLHCQVGGYVSMSQVSLDWLDDVFANQTMQN
ncbi:hydrolase or acyltransferase (alpha beta hydrolase superfamily) [Fusarium agapanthi]|uniref:Hydrolase or acyltransferase (Alpha beta hydrolase superfamily) n=1 Tax=Fusarium agapanthi TaxID=1803897 RepID=A0A9P5B5F7_9HYPO|nr:hydrolase or acyltransferase (alpha beta hydrolase superfamily) [Fusarium agapanthi]